MVMKVKIAVGLTAGLVAGLVFAALMSAMPAGGTADSMLGFGALVGHVPGRLGGWLIYLLYGMVIGALFGWLLHAQKLASAGALAWGVAYGVGWWVIAGLIVIPAALGVWPFSPFAVDRVRPVVLPLLIGHAAYGVVLGLIWDRITNRPWRRRRPEATPLTGRRAA
jgi:hypothetical protein